MVTVILEQLLVVVKIYGTLTQLDDFATYNIEHNSSCKKTTVSLCTTFQVLSFERHNFDKH